MEQNKNAMPHKWGNIQAVCKKNHDFLNKFVEDPRMERPWRTKYTLKLVQFGIQHDPSLEEDPILRDERRSSRGLSPRAAP
jgi:hypothetical protein